ncbi:eukaryotic translation initiation factor 5B [Ixodes scapularis]|uniref:eukaryotic translation initiation factor 5B n=1 Tax=Ixodes scapularis TaxID=6945 RepID=UPI001C38DBD0|nr:eukaryotic translation initiation factor 5B [Ixodes scapularis]
MGKDRKAKKDKLEDDDTLTQEMETLTINDKGGLKKKAKDADAGDGTNEDAPNRKAKAKKGAKNADSDDEDARPVTKGKKGKKGKGGGESEEEEEAVKPARKGKKGKKGAESDEEEEPATKPTKGKKGKKKGAESDEEEEEAPKLPKGKKGRKGAESDEEEEEAPKPAKGKKGRKAAESDEEEEEPAAKPAKGKKGKKKGAESDEEEEVPKLPKGKKGKKKGADSDEEEEASTKKAGGFSLLDLGEEGDEGEESGKEEEPEEEEEKVVREEKKEKKKKEKKKKKKQDDDEDELDKMLEELALEIEGKNPPPSKDAPAATPAGDEAAEAKEAAVAKKKKKREKKAAAKEDGAEDGEEPKEEGAAPAADTKKSKKKKKDAAKKEAEAPAPPSKEATPTPAADSEEPAAADVAEGSDEEGGDGKKKKKKKKDKEEEDKKKLKRPGSKQIAAIQEHLKKLKEEEEKRKQEEEERIKAEEEAERQREEKLKQEQERKERKKQKEKERRERAKAEGRLLTKAQKTARARMEATLKALKEQGIEVPQIGEKKEKPSRAMDRRRMQKKKPEDGEKTEEVPQVQLEIRGPEGTPKTDSEDPGKEGSPTEVAAHEEDDVKDAWDATSSEEEEEEVSESQTKAEVKSEVKAAPAKKREPAKKAPAKKAESSSESSSSEDSDSEEESSEESSDSEDDKSHSKEKVLQRIQKQREEAEKKRSVDHLRSPVICVLGHVDTGKTKILDTIRHTHVQDSEAGGITQQIGATMVPLDAIKEQCKMVKEFTSKPLNIPGLLIIDTPGHESFSNLRSRGSSLCDMAILVVDLMHGLEPQTIESLNMLRSRKTPFVVALNKVDRLYDWKGNRNKDITDVLKSQSRNTKLEFEERTREVVLQFAEQGLNAALFHENQDQRTFISLVPTSALSGDGMGNLISLIVDLTQNMMAKRIAFSEELQATVLEVKAIPGLGTTIDVILVNGYLREGDTMVLAGHDGPFTTPIRSLLMPQPMKELRVKNPYQEYKEVKGAQGVKIAARDLDRAIAGLQVLIAHHPDEVEVLKDEVSRSLKEVMSGFKLSERGVYVQASTLGSLEALLEFLRVSKIPYSGIRIGPVVKKDVMKASIMLEHDTQYAVILAFDVKVERDAQELADSLGVRIFQADIIYHLFDKFMAYREELRQKKRDEFKSVAVFPCKVRILPQFVFNSRDPIVVGVSIEAGVVKEGTPLCVPSKDFLEIGTVTTIEVNHKPIESARKGQEVCLKIEALGGDAPKMYGRHFDHTDFLVSKITRQSIDACKEYFRDDLIKTDWQLMVELKKLFQIL